MSSAAEFRASARTCLDKAKQASPEDRLLLLELAQSWLELAQDMEARLPVDSPFATMDSLLAHDTIHSPENR